MDIKIINGPNLNLLGIREKGIYGDQSFEPYVSNLQNKYPELIIDYFQSNVEGEIINYLHQVGFSCDGVIINAGAYTHTSVAIRDAISAIKAPVVEVHISNILTRENFRHESLIGPVCRGSIMGFGFDSYRLAIESFLE
ncbi:MAG TPA: type II 3-dehydroquinate dehydratase [Prolixibacteraceae bacterium]|nr:type II 3-dehydroquinate dehydratase [Bacteroidales bacterium]HPB05083.1 type II 3-dehydroquinate dehydratase [Prolixibacteraceae bacterium]HQN93638.1 type II 3-dehydroquinate dehydratase [Prolixibacteraceae bacterium]HUM88464.1 type II 3-dehydroquinate dehydratase [Prolixibacteraceae bacterium]